MRLFFSVGEPSGDQHAAHLIGELRRRDPSIAIEGFGGPRMEEAGCRLDYPLTNLAVMGIGQVLPLLGRFVRLAGEAKRRFRDDPPDAVVLVDFPGFNWHVAKAAKKYGVPVFYYLPPQVWAWASWRVKKVRRYVDHLLCGLPFEPAWYAERGIEAEYVGHPFFDEVAEAELDGAFLAEQRRTGGRLVALLPGSRNKEVARNWPMMLDVAERIAAKHPDVRFVVANYKPEHLRDCRAALALRRIKLPIEFHTGRTSEIIEAADCCLMVSGSVSLELLARATPAVVLYNAGWLVYGLLTLLREIDYISLPNLFAGRALLPEFPTIGHAPKAVAGMTAILDGWLTDPTALAAVRDEMVALRDDVVRTGATSRTADAILGRLAPSLRRAA